MGYTAGTFVAFEQPSTSKWNQLWDNDAFFKAIVDNGWITVTETWVYASADSPTFTFTISGVDLTTKYYPGMRIKLSQSTGGTKYFIITKVAFSTNTTITVYGGTDYTLNNETISNPYYSREKAPAGFPLSPAKWSVVVTKTTDSSTASPSAGVWNNPGTFNINLPIGIWEWSFTTPIGVDRGSAAFIDVKGTLSTANNSESDANNTVAIQTASALTYIAAHLSKSGILDLSAKATYYFNILTTQGGLANIYIAGTLGAGVIRAKSAYL